MSECIEFEYCRWNSLKIRSPFVNILKKYVEFKHTCAESEIGLGIPRDPVRLVIKDKTKNKREYFAE